MKSRKSRIARAAAGAVALTAGLLAIPSTASATSIPTGSCGSGYFKVATYPVRTAVNAGETDVYYSRATQKDCAITRPIKSWAGKVPAISVCIMLANRTHESCDAWPQHVNHYYAGPVYVYAPHKCINVEADITRPGYRVGDLYSLVMQDAEGVLCK
jgi:hypothetical protein